MLSIYDRALHHDFETFFENSKIAYTFWMDIRGSPVWGMGRQVIAAFAGNCNQENISRQNRIGNPLHFQSPFSADAALHPAIVHDPNVFPPFHWLSFFF